MRLLDPPTFSSDLCDFEVHGPVSLDFEFIGEDITIMGLCAGGVPVSVRWDSEAEQFLKSLAQDPNLTWVGHNFIDADLPLMTAVTGVEIPLERVEDTMLLLYLCHSDFSGAPTIRKVLDEESSSKGVGLLSLWCLASLYTDLPPWKQCLDGLKWNDEYVSPLRCTGPCPIHEPLWYNALDVLATDRALGPLKARAAELGIPDALYHRSKQLAQICGSMQRRGVQCDLKFADRLAEQFAEAKDNIFPKKEVDKLCGVCGRMKTPPCKKCRAAGTEDGAVGVVGTVEEWDAPFNPNSPAARDWFRERGVFLEDMSKASIFEALEELKED